jgi:hypothetical protein
MRRLRVKLAIAVAVLGVVVTAAAAVAGDGGGQLSTSLSGFEEVPVIMTTGQGTFQARLSRSADEIQYQLRYDKLEGGAVTQAHIHIGQESVSGGVAVWLCGNPSATVNPPAGTQACPPSPATITGVIRAANVVGPTGQGVSPNEFAELVRALETGVAYANVHTASFPAGEIRGQLDGDRGHDDHGNGNGDNDY